MNDRLNKMFEINSEFTEKIIQYRESKSTKQVRDNEELLTKWLKDYVLALIVEATEILTNNKKWKTHHDEEGKTLKDNVLEECIDTLKYLFNIVILFGFSPENLYEKFIDKSLVVDDKFKQHLMLQKILSNDKKVAFIDIDGVIADWPKTFIKFVNEQTISGFDFLDELEEELDKKVLYELKEQYRLSGIKRELELIEGTKEFIDKIREQRHYVVLITARPYKKYLRTYADTLHWLKKHKINYDAIIWDENKEKYIIDNFSKDKVAFVVEDDPVNARKFLDSEFKVYFKLNKYVSENYLDSKYNFYDEIKNQDEQVTIFENFSEIL